VSIELPLPFGDGHPESPSILSRDFPPESLFVNIAHNLRKRIEFLELSKPPSIIVNNAVVAIKVFDKKKNSCPFRPSGQ